MQSKIRDETDNTAQSNLGVSHESTMPKDLEGKAHVPSKG